MPVTIDIVVSPTKCKKCDECRAMAEDMAQRYPGQVQVNIIPANTPEADRYGVVLPPTVVVGDFIVAAGNVPRQKAFESIVKSEMGVE